MIKTTKSRSFPVFYRGILKTLCLSLFMIAGLALGNSIQAQTARDLGKQSLEDLRTEVYSEMDDLEGVTPADRRDAVLKIYELSIEDYKSGSDEFKDAFDFTSTGSAQYSTSQLHGKSLYEDLDMELGDLEEYGAVLEEIDLEKGDISDVQMLFDYFREIINR